MLRATGQLLLIASGYLAASVAASAFLNIVAIWSLGWDAEALPAIMAGSAFISIPLLAVFLAYFAFVPGMVAIAAAELIGARDWLFHAVAGGVVAGAALMFYGREARIDGVSLSSDPALAATLVAGGIVGGLAYWLVAGRASGAWRARAVNVPGSSGS